MSADQPLTGDELATIKARAEAVPPGEWEPITDDHGRHGLDHSVWDETPGSYVAEMVPTAEHAEHIAGMDPATTLRLVAEIERLQAEKAAILGQSEQAYRLLRISGDLGPAATLLAQMKRWPEFVESP